jgi:DNA-binding transcriptional regulator YiaG
MCGILTEPNETNYLSTMTLQHIIDDGISLSSFAQPVGVTRSNVMQWKVGYSPIPKQRDRLMRREMERRGRRLLKASLDKQSLDQICEQTGLLQAHLARRLGVSRQLFSKYKSFGFSTTMRRRIEQEFKLIGRNLIRYARK